MLELVVTLQEWFDEEIGMFVKEDFNLQFEHSLLTVSKWESKFCVPFLTSEKTDEQIAWYVGAMCFTPLPTPDTLEKLTIEQQNAIAEYISSKQTATWFKEDGRGRRDSTVVTSEIVYSWMISLNIPFECDRWHLNRLLTLIRVCNETNKPNKNKATRAELLRRQAELNQTRRQAMNTSG
jgi:hypothetical protein